MRTLLTTVALACALLEAPGGARAQDAEDAEVTKMAKEHYKLGLAAFQAGKYADAIKELKKAYVLSKKPALWINIAKTYEKMGDVDNAIYGYKKYLAESPDAPDKEQIKQALADLQAQKSGARPPPEEAPPPEAAPPVRRPRQPPPEEAAPPVRRPRQPPPEEAAPPPQERPAPVETAPMPTEWTHTPIDAAPPDRPVDVRVQTPVMKGVKVFLYYRAPGQADFTSVLMKRRGPEKVGRIPASEMSGKSVQYYIEAKDPTGTVVKSSGSPSDPNIVLIDPAAKPQIAMKEGGVEEGSVEEGEAPPPKKMSRREVRRLEEEEAPLGPGEVRKKEHRPPPYVPGRRSEKPTGKLFGPLGIAGLALAGLGVLAIGVGIPVAYFVGVAPNQNAVQSDANQGTSIGCSTTPCVFNDPNASPNDKDFQDRAKLANYMEFVMVGVGAAAAATGIALVVVDYLKQHPSAPKVKHRRRRRRPAEEDYYEEGPAPEAAPPPDDRPPEQTSIKNFFAAPMLAPGQAGVGIGFQF